MQLMFAGLVEINQAPSIFPQQLPLWSQGRGCKLQNTATAQQAANQVAPMSSKRWALRLIYPPNGQVRCYKKLA